MQSIAASAGVMPLKAMSSGISRLREAYGAPYASEGLPISPFSS